MENKNTPFMKKDRQARWSTNEVRKVLGDRVYEKDAYYTRTTCVLGFRHKQAAVRMVDGEDSYECRQCTSEDHVPLEVQKTMFQEWLDENELIDGKWKPHSNPFDSVGKAPELAFWKDSEGLPLLYRGAVHFIYGKPATFKSWFAVNLLLEADVRLWDFENGEAGTLGRLEALGVSYEQAKGYAVPTSRLDVLDRVAEYIYTKPDVLVIDGFSGLAEAMGINSESNQEVMSVFGEVFYPLKRAGVTVIILDHLPKDASNFDYPIGAQAKRSQADVAYLFKHTKSPNSIEIFVSKDRHGSVVERCEPGALPRRFGSLTLTSGEDSVSLNVSPAFSASFNGKELSASDGDLLAMIYNYIEQNPSQSKSSIETNVPGKNERKRKALKQLIEGGYVVISPVGTSHLHSVDKPLDLSWKAIGA